MTKKCSVYLTFATIASAALNITAVSLLFIELRRGTIQEITDGSVVSFIQIPDFQKVLVVAFQLLTIGISVSVTVYHGRKALKRSYGYQKMENNHLAILVAATMTTVLFIIATIATFRYMQLVLSVGAFIVINAVDSMLLCVTLYKQREKIEEFVDCILHANRAEGLPLTEQHAFDLYKLRAGDVEFQRFVRNRRYRSHIDGICIAEYYYLQKWSAELERLKLDKDDSRVDSIRREMLDRAQIFGLNDSEAMRWRELATYPHLVIPENSACYAEYPDSDYGHQNNEFY